MSITPRQDWSAIYGIISITDTVVPAHMSYRDAPASIHPVQTLDYYYQCYY